MPARVPTLLAVAALLASPAVAACGGDSGSAGGSAVTVTAKDDSCSVSDTSLAAGKTTFAVSNKGSKVTEVYVYGADGSAFTKVVEEVENIGPGTSRNLTADLKAGTYEIACKPGQQGDGIRTRIQVTGSGGSAEQGHDREVEVEATDSSLEGLDGFTGKVGEKVEFKLENKGTTVHELLIKGPDGKELGEVHETEPGATGEVVVTLATPGTYTVLCPLDGHAAKGMQATFTVA
jgi:uncharacterized cupredoxin-like copper-binding protein